VDSECASHNFIVLAICVPKVIKLGGDLMIFWQKQVGSFFDTLCISVVITCILDCVYL